MVKDVLDGLKAVSDGIESAQKIIEAVRNGKDYLKSTHPEVQGDLADMIAELRKTLNVVKQASAVLTNFSFAITTDSRGTELARFNDYFIKSKDDAQNLRNHIEDLRTHCSKIRERALHITDSATVDGFRRIFVLLGLKSPERETDLAKKLDQLAYEDFAVANGAETMLRCLESALRDVQNSLGGTSMHPEKIPDAAALLSEYSLPFEYMEQKAMQAAREITSVALELT